jgi:hypothetical protein
MAHDGVKVDVRKLQALVKRLAEQPKHVVVGVLGSKASEKHEDSDATVADVATWNHFGTSRIPARPFLTIAMERQRAEITKTFARIANGVALEKLTVEQGLGLMGETLVGEVKRTIAEGVPPANAPATIERKGSSTPLVDKGQLRGAVTYEVREGN